MRPLLAEGYARPSSQPSYLNDSSTRVRYSFTLPPSTFISIFTTSAIRRSRRVWAAVSTAVFAASSQDLVLVPMTSTNLYTLSVGTDFFAIMPRIFRGTTVGPAQSCIRHFYLSQRLRIVGALRAESKCGGVE